MKKTIIETIKNFGVEKELPGRGDLSERENLLKQMDELVILLKVIIHIA